MEICNENIAFLMRGKRPASRLEEEFFSMKTLCSTPTPQNVSVRASLCFPLRKGGGSDMARLPA